MSELPVDNQVIVVTAARVPEAAPSAPASVTVVDEERVERLGEPLVSGLLRLAPSVAVSASGPAGSLVDVRIRGAEANHTLLFVDGIRVNDPASGNAPRFELLNADIVSKIEIVRGPQSALWGSEAVGGVIAVEAARNAPLAAQAEAGSFGFLRGSASGSLAGEKIAASAALGWQRSGGIDSFDGAGDRDGYRNLSGRAGGTLRLAPALLLGASSLLLRGQSEFDGYEAFVHADTIDKSRNRLSAGRLWADVGPADSDWRGTFGGSWLGSSNRNLLDDTEVNRTSGSRRTLNGQVERRFAIGAVDQQLILALDHDREEFHARAPSGFNDQDRSRTHSAVTAEWRASAVGVSTDLAVRRDLFNRFKDATSVRASALAGIGSGVSVGASYAEGIAQPTFFDLYGFVPGDFIGNPELRPERSRGFEASLRFRRGGFEGALTGYRQRLTDEIVENATFTSTLNAARQSHRSGIEAEFGWQPNDAVRLSGHYAYLKATQPMGDSEQVGELRRPKHSGAIALDGTAGRLTYGASLTYSGSHDDTRDVFPFDRVRLDSYWLAGARLAYAVHPSVELFGRIANAFDADYQDVFGYRTEGRSIYAGLRFARRR